MCQTAKLHVTVNNSFDKEMARCTCTRKQKRHFEVPVLIMYLWNMFVLTSACGLCDSTCMLDYRFLVCLCDVGIFAYVWKQCNGATTEASLMCCTHAEVIARYRSCPAVSQIWALTVLPSTWMLRVANSTPMVLLLSRLNSFRVKRDSRLLFPTPESPISTTTGEKKNKKPTMFFHFFKFNSFHWWVQHNLIFKNEKYIWRIDCT